MQETIHTRGDNFDGTLRLAQGQLSLELVHFRTGHIYTLTVQQPDIANNFSRFLVVKTLSELRDELTLNDKMRIDDANLILPIDVQYRGRTEPLTIALPLRRVDFETPQQLNQRYIAAIEQLSKQSTHLDRYKEKALKFKGDASAPSYRLFEVTEGGAVAKYAGTANAHTLYTHCEPLPRLGVHFFETTIVKTQSKHLSFGVAGRQARTAANPHHSPCFIAFFLSERTIIGSSKSEVAAGPLELVENRSTLRLEIDMNKSVLSWYLDATFLCARKIPAELLLKELYPAITFYSPGDTLRFV